MEKIPFSETFETSGSNVANEEVDMRSYHNDAPTSEMYEEFAQRAAELGIEVS